MTKKLVDISCVLMFDHLKSYMCKASELRRTWTFFWTTFTSHVSLMYFDWDLLPKGCNECQ